MGRVIYRVRLNFRRIGGLLVAPKELPREREESAAPKRVACYSYRYF